MKNFTVLNYQGSKNNLSGFIQKNIEPYIQDGKAILDIFSGSAAVCNMFRDNYQVYANDVETLRWYSCGKHRQHHAVQDRFRIRYRSRCAPY